MKEEIENLIQELELRIIHFNRNLNNDINDQLSYDYWNGKRSEADFIVNKLKIIINESYE